ncbi:MAG: aldo/keto reductase [Eggerthellaceae bacterium]
MSDQMTIELNDGNKIPVIGFGVFQIPNDGSTKKAVLEALKAGYRHIDTAAAYFNEAEVGEAIRESGIPREEIFVTSKLWLQDHGYEPALKGLDTSLKNLGMDYVDLYLIHQPYGDVPGAWRALEQAQKDGKIRSIGVSNMTPEIWDTFVPQFDTMPAVNQVEYNPLFQQNHLRPILKKHQVALEAWAPLGQGNKDLLTNKTIVELANKYGKDAGQIILRFEIQEDCIVLPRSVKPERIKSNLDLFDFELTAEEVEQLRALDKGHGTHDPNAEGVGEMLLANYRVHD